MKAEYWSYRDRKTRKRTFRYLWIARINAAARAHGLTYSRFMEGLTASGITLDRKVLADMVITDEAAFKAILDIVVKVLKDKAEKTGKSEKAAA